MNFVSIIKSCLEKSFTFSGRATRTEYFSFVAFLTIYNGLIEFIASVFSPNNALHSLYLIIALNLLLWPAHFAVLARRLHDINYSGWWQIFITIIVAGPLAIYFFYTCPECTLSNMRKEDLPSLLLACATGLGTSLFTLYWFCKDSDPGENKYGPNPKAEFQEKHRLHGI